MNNEHTQSNTVDRRGIALMLVMIAVLVVGGMSVAYFGSRDNSIAISKNVSSASRARIAAESGLDLAIAILETNADWRNNHVNGIILSLSLIHISEPTRRTPISYAVFCLKKKFF